MKQIIALGGGGFSMEPDQPLLDEYILNSVSASKPHICFLPTASGDSEGYIKRFYEFFHKQGCYPTHLSLFKPEGKNIREYILKQDIIYVGGGSTKNMLAIWKEWGLEHILHEAYELGVLLAGISAGAICWFDQGVTDSYGEDLQPMNGLSFLSGSCCPHYDGEANRRPSYHALLKERSIMPGYAIEDGVALHFVDGKLINSVGSRANAKAYWVRMGNEEIIETEISTSYLY